MAGFTLHLVAVARQMVAVSTPGAADADDLLQSGKNKATLSMEGVLL